MITNWNAPIIFIPNYPQVIIVQGTDFLQSQFFVTGICRRLQRSVQSSIACFTWLGTWGNRRDDRETFGRETFGTPTRSPGWCFGTFCEFWWILCFAIYWEWSSQLTNIFFRGVGQPPTPSLTECDRPSNWKDYDGYRVNRSWTMKYANPGDEIRAAKESTPSVFLLFWFMFFAH